MTGGQVVVLGGTGRNFAAGMSGGIAYVFDRFDVFRARCNRQMVELFKVEDPIEQLMIRQMIERHVQLTCSQLGAEILEHWPESVQTVVKVYPIDYRRVVETQKRLAEQGVPEEKAVMLAFDQNAHDLARVGGT
jgi:glutamate synthase (ferredoxin)